MLAFKITVLRKGIFGSEWNGIKNFTYLFGSKWAVELCSKIQFYNLVFIFLGTAIAIFVAVLLNEVRNVMAQKVYQILILIPYLVSNGFNWLSCICLLLQWKMVLLIKVL